MIVYLDTSALVKAYVEEADTNTVLDPVIGRDEEIRRAIQVLQRREAVLPAQRLMLRVAGRLRSMQRAFIPITAQVRMEELGPITFVVTY